MSNGNLSKDGSDILKKCKSCGKMCIPLCKGKIFCSNKCLDEFYEKKKTINKLNKCQYCGRKIQQFKLDQKYCTEKCYTNHNKEKYVQKTQKLISEKNEQITQKLILEKNEQITQKPIPKKFVYKCEFCGLRFTTTIRNQKYCSEKCFSSYSEKLQLTNHSKSISNYGYQNSKICLFCEKQFETTEIDKDYCSLHCESEYKKAKSKIIKDDSLKEIIRIKVENLINRSKESGGSFNGKAINYWNISLSRNLHERILKRDDFSCQICGTSSNLDVHHIRPRQFGGEHKEENLITLCRKCHRHIETKDIEHATRKCFRNYLRVLRDEQVRTPKIEKDEIILILTSMLNTIYDKLHKLDYEETNDLLKVIDDFFDDESFQ